MSTFRSSIYICQQQLDLLDISSNVCNISYVLLHYTSADENRRSQQGGDEVSAVFISRQISTCQALFKVSMQVLAQLRLGTEWLDNTMVQTFQ
jgi:hypothetical protein